eukprot:1758198-Amphidinium_carterae.1
MLPDQAGSRGRLGRVRAGSRAGSTVSKAEDVRSCVLGGCASATTNGGPGQLQDVLRAKLLANFAGSINTGTNP